MDDRPTKTRGKRAVVILASGEAALIADRLRRRFDPEWFERVPPHVSVVEPFEPDGVGPDAEIVRRMREGVSGVAPFELALGDPGAFVAPALILYLSVRNDGDMRRLQERVREALGLGSPEKRFVPHLTVGRAASQERLVAELAELKKDLAESSGRVGELAFPVEAVHLFGEDPETGVYGCLASAPLSGASDKATVN